MQIPEAYSEPCQTSKIEFIAKILDRFQSLATCVKCSILDVWQGSEYAFEYLPKFNNKDSRTKLMKVIPMFKLLTLNRYLLNTFHIS